MYLNEVTIKNITQKYNKNICNKNSHIINIKLTINKLKKKKKIRK